MKKQEYEENAMKLRNTNAKKGFTFLKDQTIETILEYQTKFKEKQKEIEKHLKALERELEARRILIEKTT